MGVLNAAVTRVIPANAVYVGRPMRGLPGSIFANPFKLKCENERAMVLAQYKAWLWNNIRNGTFTIQQLQELQGKDLVCWCAPKPCHADILLEAVNWACAQPTTK